jgi:glycosyltransferase involved in cell wall biosynthesis
MRILIDALSAKRGGGITYLSNLLVDNFFDGKLKVFLLAPVDSFAYLTHPDLTIISPLPLNSTLFDRFLWYQFKFLDLAHELNIDICFFPGGTYPSIRRLPFTTVTACRNMLPFDLPQLFKYGFSLMTLRLLLLRVAYVWSYLQSTKVLFVSATGLSHVTTLLPKIKSKSNIIYHGINHSISETVDISHEATNQYFLYVSTIDVYKGHDTLLKAWHRFMSTEPRPFYLYLVGPVYSPHLKKVISLVKFLNLEKSVIFLGPLESASVQSYMSNSIANVFSSTCENCPNILLEYLSAGRPIISTSKQPMFEIGSSACLYYHPTSPASLSSLFVAISKSKSLRDHMSSLALARSHDFSWHNTRKLTRTLLTTLLS